MGNLGPEVGEDGAGAWGRSKVKLTLVIGTWIQGRDKILTVQPYHIPNVQDLNFLFRIFLKMYLLKSDRSATKKVTWL